MTKASTVLTDAYQILKTNGVNRDGWYVNRSDRPGECFCSLGAVWIATGARVETETYTDNYWDDTLGGLVEKEATDYEIKGVNGILADEAERYLEAALRDLGISRVNDYPGFLPREWPNIPTYNDNSTSDDEVFAVFEKAIELAKADETDA
jgi:hypothetical protein